MVVPFYLQILGPGMGVRCEGGVFKGALRAYLPENERHTAGWGGKEEEQEVCKQGYHAPFVPNDTHPQPHLITAT